MKQAVIYAAKSTEDTHGSIGTQLEDGRKLAARHGFTVAGEYQDEAKSAYHGNRGQGLADAIQHCERLGESALIVQHSGFVLLARKLWRLVRSEDGRFEAGRTIIRRSHGVYARPARSLIRGPAPASARRTGPARRPSRPRRRIRRPRRP